MAGEHETCAIHGEFEARIEQQFKSFGASLGKTELAILEAAREITAAAKILAASEARLEALEESNAAQWTAINRLRKWVYIGYGAVLLAGILIAGGLPASVTGWLK